MDDFYKEVIWAESTTGEDFQCVHIDYAREMLAEIERLRAALWQIENDDDVCPAAHVLAHRALNP